MIASIATAGASCAAHLARASSGTIAAICKYAAAVMSARNFLDTFGELRLAQRVLEQQPEPGRGLDRRVEQAIDAGVGEPADRFLNVGLQAGAHPVQDCPVQVGLGVEMPVQQHPGDAGLRGDVIQARGRETAARERLGRRRQDLLPALRAAQAAHRLRLPSDHNNPLHIVC